MDIKAMGTASHAAAPPTPTSWFTTFTNFLETEAEAAKAKIIAVEQEIKPIVVEYGADFLSNLAQIALGAVLKSAPLVMSGAEKLGTAAVSIVQQVEAQGKTIGIEDATAAAQAAYVKAQTVIAGTSK